MVVVMSSFEWDDHGLNTDIIKEFYISLGWYILINCNYNKYLSVVFHISSVLRFLLE